MAAAPRAFRASAKAMVCSTSQPPRPNPSPRPGPDRLAGGKHLAHRLEHLEGEAHPVLEAAAVVVAALVGQRREELVQQVAMRGMDLRRLDAETRGPPRGGGEPVADALHVLAVEHARRDLALGMGERRRGLGQPAAGRIRRHLVAAAPWRLARGLAAGMGDLDAERHRRVVPHRVEDLGQRPLGAVVPQPEISVGDPRLRRHRRRLQGQEPGARHRELAEMHHVPVGGLAVAGRILAHRGDDDAVLQLQAVEAQGLEQEGAAHAGTPVQDGRTLARGRGSGQRRWCRAPARAGRGAACADAPRKRLADPSDPDARRYQSRPRLTAIRLGACRPGPPPGP